MTDISTPRRVTILGSTGSVGQSTVDLILAGRSGFHICAITGGKNIVKLIEQARLLRPDFVAIADESHYATLKDALSDLPIRVGAGTQAIREAASMPTDWTMAAIVGLAGLQPVLDAIPATKNLAIANKEPLVAAGPLVLALAQKHGTRVLPVDSEHNAIFQVLENHNRAHISKIILTASGGPFRTWSREDMARATPAQAIAHPNWTMGAKISVDSATLMNKALEVIEAHYLFAMPADKIDVIIHPQSLIHSMVEYTDGSVLAQIGAPDMRTPIAYALAYPARMATTGKTLDWSTLSTMSFEKPDLEKFPALRLAYDCLNASPAQTIAFNAANEMAVAAFLKEQISFGTIMTHVEKIVASTANSTPSSLDDILVIDAHARSQAF